MTHILPRFAKHRQIYHSLFWILLTSLYALEDMVFYNVFYYNLINTAIKFLIIIPAIYFNIYWMIPRLLLRKKYFIYTILLLFLILCHTYLTSLLLLVIADPFFGSLIGIIVISTDILEVFAVTTALKLLKAWYEKESYAKELEKKHLESELSYLKAQVNPHFLFNTLNSIYFSISKKPALAKEIVLQLSEMLSHQLYETSKQLIPLKNEIAYLERYIELEKIRQGEIVQVDYDFPSVAEEVLINPMLLLPFVENAFKHGDKTAPGGYWIHIQLDYQEGKIYFSVENSFSPGSQKDGPGGIGLQNVKRRLELLYRDKHQLDINSYSLARAGDDEPAEEEQVFKIELRLY